MSKVSAGVTAAVLWLSLCPPHAEAQTPFLDAVRELAATAPASDVVAPVDQLRRQTAALTRMKAALGEWDRSIKALESRVARELRDASAERTFPLRVELGLAYRQRGRLEDALRELDAAAAAQPGASDVHLLRALTLDAAGKRADANLAFRTAWLRDAGNPVKAYLALRAGSDQPGLGARGSELDAAERERARKVLRDAFERTLARDKLAGGAAFLVLDPVPDSLSRTPVVADALMAAVFARLAEGKLDDALTAVSSSSPEERRQGVPGDREERRQGVPADQVAAGINDDSPLAHFERGRAAEIEGRQADARRAYTAALAGTLAGRYVLHIGIGRIAQVEGEVDAAIEAFGHAVRLNPNDPVIHRELAGAYAGAGRIDEAFAELVAALLIDPRDVDAMAAVGQLYLENARASDAVAVLSTAVEVNPNRADVHYALAVALSRAGRAEEAARQFERFERMSGQALEHRRREVTGQAAPDDVKR